MYNGTPCRRILEFPTTYRHTKALFDNVNSQMTYGSSLHGRTAAFPTTRRHTEAFPDNVPNILLRYRGAPRRRRQLPVDANVDKAQHPNGKPQRPI